MMYVVVDVGATKTLCAVFDENGNVVAQQNEPTERDFDTFCQNTNQILTDLLGGNNPTCLTIGSRGAVNREQGLFVMDDKLAWRNVSLLERILPDLDRAKKVLENDANLAALGEAVHGAGANYSYVLYVTISSGIGTGVVIDGKLPPALARSEGGKMLTARENLASEPLKDIFEARASGTAIKERWGKYGYEITDPATWEEIAKELAYGLHNMIMLLGPEVVVLGGGVSVHYKKFIEPLKAELDRLNPQYYQTPPMPQAKNVETAVIYGGYELCRQLNS